MCHPHSSPVFSSLQERGNVCTKARPLGAGRATRSSSRVLGAGRSVPASLNVRQGHRAVDARARALVVLRQRVQPALSRGGCSCRRVAALAGGQVHADHFAQVPGARRPRVRRGGRAAARLRLDERTQRAQGARRRGRRRRRRRHGRGQEGAAPEAGQPGLARREHQPPNGALGERGRARGSGKLAPGERGRARRARPLGGEPAAPLTWVPRGRGRPGPLRPAGGGRESAAGARGRLALPGSGFRGLDAHP